MKKENFLVYVVTFIGSSFLVVAAGLNTFEIFKNQASTPNDFLKIFVFDMAILMLIFLVISAIKIVEEIEHNSMEVV